MDQSSTHQTAEPEKNPTEPEAGFYINGILNGNREILTQALDLIGSTSSERQALLQTIIGNCLPHSGKAFRIHISGLPGSGKKSLIRALIPYWHASGEQAAIFRIDTLRHGGGDSCNRSATATGDFSGEPSHNQPGNPSQDKHQPAPRPLAQTNPFPENLFDPFPAGFSRASTDRISEQDFLRETLRKTRQAILLCEAAGFTRILLTTSPDGPFETDMRDMADYRLLLIPADIPAGRLPVGYDAIEKADCIAITKADREFLPRAASMQTRLQEFLNYFTPNPAQPATITECCSAQTGEGIRQLHHRIIEAERNGSQSGETETRRRSQNEKILQKLFEEQLLQHFYRQRDIDTKIKEIRQLTDLRKVDPETAVRQLLASCFESFASPKNIASGLPAPASRPVDPQVPLPPANMPPPAGTAPKAPAAPTLKLSPKLLQLADRIPHFSHALAVDAACSGNPGIMEYQGVQVNNGKLIFKMGPYPDATNNIGEFLAIVHALSFLNAKGFPNTPIYSDSVTGMAWVRKKKANTKIEATARNKEVLDLIARAEKWLHTHTYRNPILKWETEKWGEIPADFGRK